MKQHAVSQLNWRFAVVLSLATYALFGALLFTTISYWAWPQPTDNKAYLALGVIALVGLAGMLRQALFLSKSLLFAQSRGLYWDGDDLVFISPSFKKVRRDEISGVSAPWIGRKWTLKWQYIQIDRHNGPPIRFLAKLFEQPPTQVIELAQA